MPIDARNPVSTTMIPSVAAIPRFLSRRFSIVLLALTLTACSEPPYTNIDNTELKALIDKGVPVYDIRRADEWRQTGVVQGSRQLTFVDEQGRVNPRFLREFTAEVGKDDPVVLICRTGNRTDTLARYLVERLGYAQVYNVEHGIRRWIGDRQPVMRH
jgi:rhodanese-related sulfurtransferase